MNRPMPKFDGPIPGENYTADVKNFPWHRPPSNPDYVSTVEDALKRVVRPQTTGFVEAALSSGDSVVDVVTGLLRIGVSKGYYSIDNAVLAAGPLAKMIELIGDELNVDYRKEWDEDPFILTSELIKTYTGMGTKEKGASAPDTTTSDKPALQSGLMAMTDQGPASEDAQSQMLGYDSEESV